MLAVDANVLVGELLRVEGQELIMRSKLELSIAEEPWAETQEHLPRRVEAMVAQRRIGRATGQALLAAGIATARDAVRVIPTGIYAMHEQAARSRVPADGRDWPTVALALALDADIWTLDGDYLGCGRVTWTTDTLRAELERPYMPQWTYAVVVLSRLPGQPVWLAVSEGEALTGIPNSVTSPWDVLPAMGRDGWEFVEITRTGRTRSTGDVETLDLVFKKRG